MAQSRPGLSSLGGSRTSITSVGKLPVIDEDDSNRTAASSPTRPSFVRLPRKTYQRAIRRGRPPPYVSTPTHLPPTQPDSMEKELGRSEARLKRLEASEKHFFVRQRSWWRFLVLLVVLVVVVIALAVGLTIGLQKKHHDSDSDSTTSPTKSPVFPAGSYSFNTTLQTTTTDCTSNPATWTCYPYDMGSSAAFFWVINATKDGDGYTISSTNNPFAPSFTDLSLQTFDSGAPTERLVFSFSLDRNIVPTAAITSDDRAATCTFDNTAFEATLWTHRQGNQTVESPAGGSFPAWPGNIEVAEIMNSTSGQPKCKDDSGTILTTVKSGTGSCQCLYASFEL